MRFSEMHLPALPHSLFPLPSSIPQNSSEVVPKGWQDTKQLSHATCSHLVLTYQVMVKEHGEVLTRLNLSSTICTTSLCVTTSYHVLFFSTDTTLSEYCKF